MHAAVAKSSAGSATVPVGPVVPRKSGFRPGHGSGVGTATESRMPNTSTSASGTGSPSSPSTRRTTRAAGSGVRTCEPGGVLPSIAVATPQKPAASTPATLEAPAGATGPKGRSHVHTAPAGER
jgi:hypothetical protein